MEFYENRLSYSGKFFNDLSSKDQRHFQNSTIGVAELINLTLNDKLKIFVKINTTGKVMDKQHLEDVKKMIIEEN